MLTSEPAAVFAAVFATLWVAHTVGDHWVQTEHQAACKGLPGWAGRRACLGHVATYTATAAAGLGLLVLATGLRLSPAAVSLGLLLSAVTHYWADRRTPLRRLAARLGHSGFYQLGVPRPGRADNPSLGTGAYALDQSFHTMFLFLAALLIGGWPA